MHWVCKCFVICTSCKLIINVTSNRKLRKWAYSKTSAMQTPHFNRCFAQAFWLTAINYNPWNVDSSLFSKADGFCGACTVKGLSYFTISSSHLSCIPFVCWQVKLKECLHIWTECSWEALVSHFRKPFLVRFVVSFSLILHICLWRVP